MIGQILNGYKVVATGVSSRDTSVLLGVNTQDQGDKYVVASIATQAVLDSAEKPPTWWNNGGYTSDLSLAVGWYLHDIETGPERLEKLLALIVKGETL